MLSHVRVCMQLCSDLDAKFIFEIGCCGLDVMVVLQSSAVLQRLIYMFYKVIQERK